MYITPSTSTGNLTAVTKNELIVANDLKFGVNALNSQVIDKTDNSNFTNIIRSLLNDNALTSIRDTINNERTSTYNVSSGEILSGLATYNYIKYGFEQLSHIRWCKVIYKNPEYKYEKIFDNTSYALTYTNFILLKPDTYTQGYVNYVPFDSNSTKFYLLERGTKAPYDYTRNDKDLDGIVGNFNTNRAEYNAKQICKAGSVNNLISKFNTFFINPTQNSSSNAKLLSCTVSNAPGYKFSNKNYDTTANNNKMYLHIALHTNLSNYNDLKTSNVFSFSDIARSLTDVQYTNLKTNGHCTINLYQYNLKTFSLNSIGLNRINCEKYKIYGWCCIRTTNGTFSNARAELLKYYIKFNTSLGSDNILTNITETINSQKNDNIFAYYSYGNKIVENNFNNVRNIEIPVNLGNKDNGRTHYWLFPIMKIQIKSVEPKYLNLNNVTINEYDNKILPAGLGTLDKSPPGTIQLQGGYNVYTAKDKYTHYNYCKCITAPSNGNTPSIRGSLTQAINANDKFYGLYLSNTDDVFWTAVTNATTHDNYLRTKNYNYYPLSNIIHLVMGTNLKRDDEYKDVIGIVELNIKIFNTNDINISTITIQDGFTTNNTDSDMAKIVNLSKVESPYYITFEFDYNDTYAKDNYTQLISYGAINYNTIKSAYL